MTGRKLFSLNVTRMPIQQTSPSDLIRQKRLLLQTNANPKPEWGGLTPRNGVLLPIKISAINNAKFVVTPSQKNFTTGIKISPITHIKF